jgi:hypothetical protein
MPNAAHRNPDGMNRANRTALVEGSWGGCSWDALPGFCRAAYRPASPSITANAIWLAPDVAALSPGGKSGKSLKSQANTAQSVSKQHELGTKGLTRNLSLCGIQ